MGQPLIVSCPICGTSPVSADDQNFDIPHADGALVDLAGLVFVAEQHRRFANGAGSYGCTPTEATS